MLDRVRQWAATPIPPGATARRVVVGWIATIVIVAGVLVATRDAVPEPSAPPAPVVTETETETTPPPPAPRQVEVTTGMLADAESVVRRFMRTYLPFTYGRGDADRIRGATPELRRALAANPPRVPPRQRRRRPRVIEVQSEDATPYRVRTLVIVADGAQTYSMNITVERTHSDGDWRVTAVA